MSDPTNVSVATLVGVLLGHGVQSAAVLKPLDLTGVEGVGQLDVKGLAVLGLDDKGNGAAGCELSGLDVNLFAAG